MWSGYFADNERRAVAAPSQLQIQPFDCLGSTGKQREQCLFVALGKTTRRHYGVLEPLAVLLHHERFHRVVRR